MIQITPESEVMGKLALLGLIAFVGGSLGAFAVLRIIFE